MCQAGCKLPVHYFFPFRVPLWGSDKKLKLKALHQKQSF